MFDFINAIRDIMLEQGKAISDLFKDGVVSENTFYKYSSRNPSLKTLIKIANYLKVSIDYIYENTDENNFKHYAESQSGFYENLMKLINNAKLSGRQFTKDLHYSKDNILRWKKGTEPNIETLLEIAKYFGCNVDDLLIFD